jgi:hypothetical protein
MRTIHGVAVACLLWLAAIASLTAGQQPLMGGPLTGPAVLDAPFSADATTTVRQTLPDGTRVERTGIARYYRDRAGRVRIEHLIVGLDPLNSAPKGQVRTIIAPDPKNGVYTLDDATRTANLGLRFMYDLAVGGGGTYALPLGGPRWASLIFTRTHRRFPGPGANEEQLGTRQVSGIESVGRRITITMPANATDNTAPTEIIEERWESRELKLLIHSMSSDPRTGVIEYRLTNVRRADPAADLFTIPDGYMIASTGDNGWTGVVYAERNGQATKRW